MKEHMDSSFRMSIIVLCVLAVFAFASMQCIETFTGGSGSISFTMYRLNSCGWCHKAMPEWKRLVALYKGPVRLADIEAHENPRQVQEMGVDSFPTFLLHNSATGQSVVYKGERTAEAFMEFLSRY